MATGGQEQDLPLNLAMERAPVWYKDKMRELLDKCPLKEMSLLRTMEEILKSGDSRLCLKMHLIQKCVIDRYYENDKIFLYTMWNNIIAQKLKEDKDLTFSGRKKNALGLRNLALYKVIQEVFLEKKKTNMENVETLSKYWLKTKPKKPQL